MRLPKGSKGLFNTESATDSQDRIAIDAVETTDLINGHSVTNGQFPQHIARSDGVIDRIAGVDAAGLFCC